MDSLGHVTIVVDRVDLTLEPFVDPDRVGFHAHGHHVADDLRHHFGGGHDAGRAGAVDLDADHVGRSHEACPGISRVLIAGEVAHAARHHLANDRRIDLLACGVDTFLCVDGCHAAWIRSRHSGLGGRLEPRYY